jgi:peptide/nickel transport system substrate-binding protein
MRMRTFTRGFVALSIAGAMVMAGCGGDDDEEPTTSNKAPQRAKQGGELTVLYGGDVDSMDPGISYYQYGFLVHYALHRPLFSYKPDDATTPVPDLAEAPAEISEDGKTVTVKLRAGVKFSPPVNREVTSDDVRYAIERAFTKQVPGPYVGAYFGDLTGLKAFQDGKAKEISGIETPDDRTIIFKLDRARGAIVAGALSLPASSPVPREYARKYDTGSAQSKYGQYLVTTGPYMVQNNAKGRLTGYKPGREIRLVRNPNWSKATDYKPAYLDAITIKEGTEPDVGSRQILSGSHLVSGDFQLPATILARASRGAEREQLVTTPPTGRYRYIALNTRVKPFDDVNVRKAIVAAFDREGIRQAFGGPITGEIPTHYIPPGQPGFEEAGGKNGPGLDFMRNPKGDLNLAKEYMKKAGYETGMYDGPVKEFTAIGDNATQQERVSEAAVQEFKKLGFNVRLRSVSRDAMYTTYCQVPKKEPDVCPSVGWLKDFADPEASLGAPFAGYNIIDVGNSNFALLDDKNINTAMKKAEVINDKAERNKAWGEIDKMITEAAPGIPWLWDTQAMLQSKDVNGVATRFNAAWDLTYMSLK